uniref:CASP-like protein n=1 Tax=Zea mays TaxID=4577 RepID=A0A804NGA7_MAIZE|eukprot:XP_008675298.1 CASP-like protein 4U1 isoform X3 [Zea mays]
MASTPRTPAPDRSPPPPLVTHTMPSTPRTPVSDRSPPPVTHTMPSTPRTPAPDRSPPPVPTPPPPLETPPPPSPSSQPGDEYHTPPPSLADGSPREEASFPSDGAPKSPQLSPMRLAAPRLLPPPSPPTPTAQNGQGEEGGAKAAAREPLRLATGLARSPSSQRSLATATNSLSPSPSPTPPSPLTPAPVVDTSSNNNNNRSGQSTPKRAETKVPLPLPSPAATAAVAVRFDPVEEAVTSPLHLGKARLDQQQEQHAAAAENAGSSVPPDVAAVAAVGERRELSVTLRLATAVLSLAAFSVIASARTSGWAGDYYAHHLQYSERDRLRLLDRAIVRRNPPPDLTQVYIPEHVKLLLQPVPGPGSGVPPHVGVVGGRVAQRPVGVQVRHGRLQQEDHQRPVAVLHCVPDARSERAHLHG